MSIVFTQTLLNSIKLDNIFVQYGVNLLLLSISSYINNKIPSITNKLSDLFSRKYSSISFVVYQNIQYENSSKLIPDELEAWLSLFRKKVLEKKSKSRVKNISTCKRSYGANADIEYSNSLVPDSSGEILIVDSADIWIKYWTSIIIKSDYYCIEHNIKIYSRKLDLSDLLTFNNKLLKSYIEKKNKLFSQKSHIFELLNDNDNMNYIRSNNKGLSWIQTKYNSNVVMENIWFEHKSLFKKKYANFINGRELYAKRNIPWTFSCLLHGEPGCGKTSIIKSIVNMDKKLNMISHIIIIPFNIIKTRSNFLEIMFGEKINNNYISYDRRIYVFEDFDICNDIILKKREKNITTITETYEIKKNKKTEISEKLNLADILNILDGIMERTGQRIFWTTNISLDIFDPAFLRPGRINMKIKLGKCSAKGIKFILERYYNEHVNFNFDKFSHKFTPAEIKEFCLGSNSVKEFFINLNNKSFN